MIGQRGADGLGKKTVSGRRGARGLSKKTETPAEIRGHKAGDKGFII